MKLLFSNFNTIFNDVAQPWQLGFQDSAAPGFTGLVTLHNTVGFYLVVICFSVFWVLFSIIYNYNYTKNPIAHKYLTHGTVIELIWTITPALILIAIAFPSFRLLYLMDKLDLLPEVALTALASISSIKITILNYLTSTILVV
jgi:cytochrome c oxidase subunit 2